MKRILSLLLCLLLLASLAALPAQAETMPYEGKTVILATGNLRGRLQLYPKIKHLKDTFLAQGAEVILVDSGNFLQGEALANATRGSVVYELMDAVGYEVANLGLAEFSYADATTGYVYHGNFTRYYTQKMLQEGTEEITYNVNRDGSTTATLAAREPATFQAICATFTDESGNYAFVPNVGRTTESGLKLFFVGNADPAIAQQVPDETLKLAAAEDVAADADLVVQLSNDPVTPALPDAIRILTNQDSDPESVFAVIIDQKTKTYETKTLSLAEEKPDAALKATVDALLADAPTAVGTAAVTLEGRDSKNRAEETNFGDLATDALKWYAETYIDGWDKTLPLVALQNGGNCDNFLYTGAITETDLLRAMPFSPMGVGVIELTGEQLLETLETACQSAQCPGFAQVSGLQYTIKAYEEYDAGGAYGKFYRADSIRRVEITEVGGKPFDPKASYAVVADNYLINGNDTYYVLKEAKDAGAKYINNGGGAKLRDIVARYLDKQLGGTLGQPYDAPQGRITIRTEAPKTPENPFTDVAANAYFTDAVLWAVDSGVTNGTSETTFSPNENCTRGQIVTFLYRAYGSQAPEAQASPFADVAQDAYYYRAVLWALDAGITKGTSETTFSPYAPCTRAQAVTFLWRAAGTPAPVTNTDADELPVVALDEGFADVPQGAYYYDAVRWATANNVTNGTSATTFSPGSTCTRAQIVTFLYRALAEKSEKR